MSRAWIFTGGEFSPTHLRHYRHEFKDHVICVDAGLAHCLALGWQPTQVVGDFDSVDHALLDTLKNVPIERHSPIKNESDLQLAFDFVENEPVDEVLVLGASGGRSDHHMFNWMLPLVSRPRARLRMLDGSVDAVLVTPELSFEGKLVQGTTVSLLPLLRSTGVSISGFDFPLSSATLEPGSTRSLSNLTSTNSVSVSIDDGMLWLMEVLAPQSGC